MKGIQGSGLSIRDWKRAAFGIGVGVLVMLGAVAGFAWLMDRQIMDREHMGLASAAVLALSSFLGGISAGRGEGRFLRCGAVGAGIVLILLLLNLLFFDGNLKGILPVLLMIAGGIGAAALLSGDQTGSGRRKYRYPKYQNR